MLDWDLKKCKIIIMLQDRSKDNRFNVTKDITWKNNSNIFLQNYNKKNCDCFYFLNIYSKLGNLCILIELYKDDK